MWTARARVGRLHERPVIAGSRNPSTPAVIPHKNLRQRTIPAKVIQHVRIRRAESRRSLLLDIRTVSKVQANELDRFPYGLRHRAVRGDRQIQRASEPRLYDLVEL